MATLIIEHSERAPADRLAATLRDLGHRLSIVPVHRHAPLPADLDGIDAIVSCGGPQSPLEAAPWLEPEMALLRAADALAMPVVGLCLGSQILARALGGEVGALEGGIECGWTELTLTPAGREDPLYAGQPWQSMQLCWHRFHVTAVPEGARVLAGSQRTPIQAWARGLRTFGIQYHPESYRRTLERWAAEEPGALSEAGLTGGQLAAGTDAHADAAARLADRLFQTMALVVMPLDRRFAGMARDLDH